MPVSQSSDKPTPPSRAIPGSLGGVPAAYTRLHNSFTWVVPARFNIAEVCCARWAALPDAAKNIAVHAYSTRAGDTFHSYAQLQEQANRLSNVLVAQGVVRGDRVAIVMPQCFETAVAYIAVLQMGAVAMPLSLLFGPDALEYRLQDSEAVLAIADVSSLADLQLARKHCPLLRTVMGVGEAEAVQAQADCEFADALAQFSTHFTPVQTAADDPAILIYTSGTTGNPKGALLAHRALIGNLPGFVASQNWFGFDPFGGDAGDRAPLPVRGGAGGRGEHTWGNAQSAG